MNAAGERSESIDFNKQTLTEVTHDFCNRSYGSYPTSLENPYKNPYKKSLIKPMRWLSPVLPDKIEIRVSQEFGHIQQV
jgi:hypothetical protein